MRNFSTLLLGLALLSSLLATEMHLTSAKAALQETPIPTEQSITDAQGVEMNFVPAGSFQMGYTLNQYLSLCSEFQPINTGLRICSPPNEKLILMPHRVEMGSFYIDTYEVSIGAYTACVESGGCSEEILKRQLTAQIDMPIVRINVYEAEIYCNWRNAHLPTEEEWEYAAAGTENFTFPWGNTFDGTKVNVCDASCSMQVIANQNWNDGYSDIAPIQAFETDRSWVGAYNLGGNVAEWTSTRVYIDDLGNDLHIVKGSASITYAFYAASWTRIAVVALSQQTHVGFRCARMTR